MSLFSGPEEHTANPPETWVVHKAGERNWQLQTKDGGVLDWGQPTKKRAEALRAEGWYVEMYDKERRWYAGEDIPPWKPWAQCQAEQEATRAWLANR